MRVNYHYAILSYCPDLTDPSSQSFPVGMVAIGKIGDNTTFAISIARSINKLCSQNVLLDPFSMQIVENFHTFIDKQLKEGLEKTGINDFLFWLQNRLRNTIHISHINCRECEVEQPDHVLNDALRLFNGEIEHFDPVLIKIEENQRGLPDIRMHECQPPSHCNQIHAHA